MKTRHIFDAFAVLVAGGAIFIAYERYTVPPMNVEIRAVVHEVCPAGGIPLPASDDAATEWGNQMGLMFSSELIKSKPMQRAWFCAMAMWK